MADYTVREAWIRRYREFLRLLDQIRQERAADPAMANVPGGKTGFIVARKRAIGSGDAQRLVTKYEVDTDLLREYCELQKQLAIECGMTRATVDGGTPVSLKVTVTTSSMRRPDRPQYRDRAAAVLRTITSTWACTWPSTLQFSCKSVRHQRLEVQRSPWQHPGRRKTDDDNDRSPKRPRLSRNNCR